MRYVRKLTPWQWLRIHPLKKMRIAEQQEQLTIRKQPFWGDEVAFRAGHRLGLKDGSKSALIYAKKHLMDTDGDTWNKLIIKLQDWHPNDTALDECMAPTELIAKILQGAG